MTGSQLPIVVVAVSLLGACLGPRAEDDPGYSHRVWPEGKKPASLEDNERLSLSIADADGMPDIVMPRAQAFLAGEIVEYWDFGEASTTAGPAWIFLRKDDDDESLGKDVGHPALVDTAPGDDDYGPLRSLFAVYVTKRYRGEVIPSFAALEDALELGLIEEPVATGEVVAWPLVRVGAELELSDEELVAPDTVLYRGHLVPCFKLDKHGQELGMPMLSRGRVRASDGFILRRHLEDDPVVGGELFMNLVLTRARDSMGYTGMVEISEITVPQGYVFGDVTDVDQLFPPSEEEGEEPRVSEVVLEKGSIGSHFMPLIP